ncbi:MAG TPA: hypothetical protein VFT17_05525, partial [Propionibacteriaceae bacterium]|nr:hypothetical protein [Propionibacteriaceae bacterium]
MRASRQASQPVGDDDPPSWHRAYRAYRQAQAAHASAAGLTTITLACCLILLVLLTPNDLGRLTPSTFVSIPLEAVVGLALLLILPEKLRRVGALLLGLGLGLLAILKLLDMGFSAVLARPFDPGADWTLLNDAMSFLAGAVGPFSAIGCLVAVIIFCTSLVFAVTKSVQRLTDAAAR